MKKLFIALGASFALSFFVAVQIIHAIELSDRLKATKQISVIPASTLLTITPTAIPTVSSIPSPIGKPLPTLTGIQISLTKVFTPTAAGTISVSPTPIPVVVHNQIKVMPLGDSITDGALIPGGYRTLLWQLLVANDKDNIDFVGSHSSGTTGDLDNEGHIGWDMNQLDVYAYNWMQLYKPDIVLLHIGSNDLDKGATSADLIQRMTKLLSDIYAGKPDTYVVMATIIPSSHGHNDDWSTYNAAIPGVAAQFSGSHKIIIVNMANALSEGDLLDGLHPNQGGYNKMAYTWYPTVSMIYRQMTGR